MARKIKNYDLFSSHAWYVPGVKGMFGLVGWFLVGALLGGIVQSIMALFLFGFAYYSYYHYKAGNRSLCCNSFDFHEARTARTSSGRFFHCLP